jgi:hypothetical protein
MMPMPILAAATALAHLVSTLPPSPDLAKAPYLSTRSVVEGVARVTVTPGGVAQACQMVSPSVEPRFDATACADLRAARFEPAHDAEGHAVVGVLDVSLRWSAADGAVTPFVSQDVDLTLQRLPKDAVAHPITQLALTVDAAGHVQGCDVVGASGVPGLDAVACTAGVKAASIEPARLSRGAAVASVQSLNIGFGSYAPAVFRRDGHYAALGEAGPFFPEREQRLGVSGYAVLGCAATPDGSLHDCSVEEEFPAGADFGIATLRMAQTGWMKAQNGSGDHVLLRVDFPASPGFRNFH